MLNIGIIGGGIGGLTTAIALLQRGVECEVFERAPELLDVGAAIAVWPNATRVLSRLGLLEQILDHAGVIEQISWLHRDGKEINRVRLPTDLNSPALALHRADLQRILLQSLPPASLSLGSDFVGQLQNDEHVVVRFANRNAIRCDFLVGADGIHSEVRKEIVEESNLIYRGYLVWRGISPERPPGFDPHTAVEIHGQGRRFGIGPVGASRVGWWAAANTHRSEVIQERSGRVRPGPDDAKDELLQMFNGWSSPVVDLIGATPAETILRTEAYDRTAHRSWGIGRVTLLGDAVHPTTPNLGQGGCMAIEDGMILSRCLEKYGLSVEALRKYEHHRYSRTAAVARYSRMYGVVGQVPGYLAVAFRNRLMSMVPEQVVLRVMRVVFDYDSSSVRI